MSNYMERNSRWMNHQQNEFQRGYEQTLHIERQSLKLRLKVTELWHCMVLLKLHNTSDIFEYPQSEKEVSNYLFDQKSLPSQS